MRRRVLHFSALAEGGMGPRLRGDDVVRTTILKTVIPAQAGTHSTLAKLTLVAQREM